VVPRTDSMERRRASVEETRRRIVEATMALHAERGIFGTSWKEIAARADVAVATVYKHFPTLAELVPACGERVVQISVPPAPEDVEPTFRDAPELPERLSRLIAVFHDFYERGEPYLEIDARERQLPEVREWEAFMGDLRERFVREALRPLDPDEPTVRTVAALLDFPVFRSFRRQGVTRESAAAALHGMLLCWLPGARSGDGSR
jgi:AcrR family transcriptional regulator